MKQVNQANLSPAGRTMRRQMFTIVCCAYIFLGFCSIAAGILLYVMPMYMGSKEHVGGIITVVLIGFGLARIGTAIINLRRLNRGRKSGQGV